MNKKLSETEILLMEWERAIIDKAGIGAQRPEEADEILQTYADSRYKLFKHLECFSKRKNTQNIKDFAKMLQKKIPEYLEEVDNSSSIQFNNQVCTERYISENELKAFLRWIIEQTSEYKRLQAERRELLSKADEIDQKMKEYVEEGWVR